MCGRSQNTMLGPARDASRLVKEGNMHMNMDVGSKERRLLFLRRMIWWMPALTFAIVATLFVVFAQGMVTAVLWGVAAGLIVGVAVLAAYFGYKAMLDRSST